MKHIIIDKLTNKVLLTTLTDPGATKLEVELLLMEGKAYFLEVADDFNTSEVFKYGAVVVPSKAAEIVKKFTVELAPEKYYSKVAIFSAIRYKFEELKRLDFIIGLINKHGAFAHFLEVGDFEGAKYVIDKIPASDCKAADKKIIIGFIP